MRSANSLLSVAALVGLAAASPAPQQLDFNQLTAAATVQNGPSFNGIVTQSASLVTAVSASTTATASVTGTATAAALAKRELAERDMISAWYCLFFGGCNTSSSSSKAASTTTKASSSSSSSTAVLTTSASSSVCSATMISSSSYSPYYAALSTGSTTTTKSGSTGTGTTSSTSACVTTPEDGTYCGFLNPEDPCAPQPDGYGPVPTPDTVSAFYAYAPFHSMASAAPTSIPAAVCSGTAQAYQQTFRDLNASSSAQSYIGLYTLKTYDAAQCAAYCDGTALCTAFNIYIERDPSVAPCNNDSTAPTVWGYNCPNPASMTSYKCSLWGSNLDASTATNAGQMRESFQVVITGSNGYDKTNVTTPSVTGTTSSGNAWGSGTNCGSKAINAPNYWMGSKFIPGPFNPQLCADFALSQNSINKAQAVAAGHSSYTPCNMFNAYYIHKNNKPAGTYCALYDTDVSTKYATYSGATSGSDRFDCKQSFKFTLKVQDSGKC